MKKRKTLSAIIMTLFLIINIVMISCGSGGPAPKEGQAAKADGTVIDLAKISKKIKDAVEFAASVKEIETLVKSVDELAKAIGKKIQNSDTLGSLQDKNGSLLAGVYSVVSAVKTKLEALEQTVGISDELKAKVSTVKTDNKSFLDKLKGGNAELGIEGATDDNSKKAIDRIGKKDGDKGVAELLKLNTAVDELVTAVKAEVEEAFKELTSSVKAKPF